ncbi:MAG: PhnD/SsuA/transferrin family substrate-binding protein, partial [Rhodoferax sp.]|nr:PhnD/SsuA/transferrin family substrate-binding protein [Rhodoferax sp.]
MSTPRPSLHLLPGALALAGMLLIGTAQAQAPTALRFSPVNQYGIELTASYWNPIIDYVSGKSGVKLQLKIGRTSADTTAYVLANEVEFVFSNHLFSPERDHLGWKVFGRRDTPPLRSQIVVLADSPLHRLEQLAGQPVAFPG